MVPAGVTTRSREAWVRAHADGDLIAASTLQPGLRWFETSFGGWAYADVAGHQVTLGGPLCAPADRRELLARFLARSRRPILMYLREDLLPLVAAHGGLRCAGIGIDRHVDVPALLAAPAPEVRAAARKAARAGFRLRPLELAALDPSERQRLDQITARYLARSQVEVEMAFLNWPMSARPEPLRRVYSLDKFDREHQGSFGYAVLNPIFADGRRTGWLLDILRFEPTRLWGVWLATVHALAEELAAAGEGLSIGFAPLDQLRPAAHAPSRALQAQLDGVARYLGSVRYLRRLRELKRLIPGPAEPRYLASYTRVAPVVLYAFFRAMRVPIGPMLGPKLVETLAEGLRGSATLPR